MKTNLILFATFLTLLGVTYFFQEIKGEKDKAELESRDQILKEEVHRLKLLNIEGTKDKGRWWSGTQLLSQNLITQLLKKLENLKKIKTIEGEWSRYSTHPFDFEINQTLWSIGNLSLDQQGFYLKVGPQIYLAVVEGDSYELTQNPQEIAKIKLEELLSLLSRPRGEMIETQLFRFYPDLVLNRVVIEVAGSLPFELSFKENKTIPEPIRGVSPHQDLRGKFQSLLTQMTIKSEVPYVGLKKFKKLGEISFFDEKLNTKWELWLKDQSSADAFIVDHDLKKSYLMVGGTLKLFFVRDQDYWDKKVIPFKDFQKFSKLKLLLTQGSKSEEVIVLNREPLVFESKKFKVIEPKMNELLGFIFNLGINDQADRVSLLSKWERNELLKENRLRLEVMNQELLLWRKKEELIVVNLTQGFKVHFAQRDESFSATFEDVLK